MARVVRKVSSKASKGMKKEKKFSKKQLTIFFSCIALVIVAVVGIIIGVNVSKSSSDSEEDLTNTIDYFLQPELVDESYSDVKFTKANAAGVECYADLTKNPNYEFMFIFAYDSTSFYPEKGRYTYENDDDEEEDKFDEDQKKVFEMLVNLQKEIDTLKAKLPEGKQNCIQLFIVDVSVGHNSTILSNTNLIAADDSASNVAFSVINQNEAGEKDGVTNLYGLVKEAKIENSASVQNQTLSTINDYASVIKVLPVATNYVRYNISNDLLK